jgi:hypothetical protein
MMGASILRQGVVMRVMGAAIFRLGVVRGSRGALFENLELSGEDWVAAE